MTKVCADCGKEFESAGSDYCPECILKADAESERAMQDRESDHGYSDSEVEDARNEIGPSVDPQASTGPAASTPTDTSPAGMKQAALKKAGATVIGGANAEKVSALTEGANRAMAQARTGIARTQWAVSSFISAVTNPAFWIAVASIIVIFLVANMTVTTYQTVGSIAQAGAGSGMADNVLESLAQRAVLLSQDAYKYPTSDGFVSAHDGNPSKTNNNPWPAACPDIVNIIYGLPDHYIGNNGIDNAYNNYKRLIAAGMVAQAWSFPETSSPGADLQNPPAGAIVSATGSGAAGHTYVVLTADGKVIDNTWNVNARGPATGQGYRVLNAANRAGIRGWFVPPAEGYMGTFLDKDPMLPAVPAWAANGGGTTAPAS